MRRALTIIFIIAAISVASWFGYQQFGLAKAAEAPDYDVVTVHRGNIAATVSATGAVLAEREANLTFQGAGTISGILVEVGDQIKRGQVLAQLDTTDLELAVRQAEISLRTARAQRRQLDEAASFSDIAAAQAALESAQAAYQDLLNGTDADQLAAARASVEQARVSMEQAQQAYNKIKDMPNAGLMPQALQLQQATINYETAEAQYRVAARGANEPQLAAARAQVAQAQANLDRLFKGPSAEQVEISDAGIDQAQLALDQAERRLEDARITAPWDGIVTTVNIVEGTMAQPGAPAIQMADLSQFHIDVQVDEIDIANIDEGQQVTIEVDAVPDEQLTGKVAKVAPAATTTATGGVSYQVTINFDPTDIVLRAGMSATATIVSSSRQDVLLLPNRAIQRERETGKTFVERIGENGFTQRVEVRVGLRDDQQSEIRDGLDEGDQLAIRNRSFQEQIQMTFGGP